MFDYERRQRRRRWVYVAWTLLGLLGGAIIGLAIAAVFIR